VALETFTGSLNDSRPKCDQRNVACVRLLMTHEPSIAPMRCRFSTLSAMLGCEAAPNVSPTSSRRESR
jgi:hypothetical protein